MDINSLLKIFKSVDTNNDLIISNEELTKSSLNGSIWGEKLKANMHIMRMIKI